MTIKRSVWRYVSAYGAKPGHDDGGDHRAEGRVCLIAWQLLHADGLCP